MASWYQKTVEKVFDELQTSMQGLSDKQVQDRIEKYGKNVIPIQPSRSVLRILISQFTNPLMYLLAIAVVLSLLFDQLIDAGFIMVIIFLNTLLAAFQEWKAEQEYLSLEKFIQIKARVKRAGKEFLILAQDLVPGDLIILEQGVRVPADTRLILCDQLQVNEAILTGESYAQDKQLESINDERVLAERSNMAYAGTTVSRGKGLAIVIATGLDMEIGKISHAVISATESKTPLLIRLEKFSYVIAIVIACAVVIIFSIGLCKGAAISELLFMSIGLIVAAIPEDLPVIITLALSLASRRMAKRKVIIRKLSAVEGLGSCTCIASDKTGTLTMNKQTIARVMLQSGEIFNVTGVGYNGEGQITTQSGETVDQIPPQLQKFAIAGILSSDAYLEYSDGAWRYHGDDVDVAFYALAYKIGLNPLALKSTYKPEQVIPFHPDLRYAATIYKEKDLSYVAIKGAPEALLSYYPQNGREKIEAFIVESADRGYRVLAVGSGRMRGENVDNKLGAFELEFFGLVAMIDPLRPEAKQAVLQAQRAGVRVIMITGDNNRTALTLAQELGIAQTQENVMTGDQLSQLVSEFSLDFAAKKIESISVFARITPTEKLNLIKLLKKQGHFVIVTGDGVNDAPALKEAHVGVAMGSGVDIAQEVASTIIADDNFASIVAGIEEGRIVYVQIRKVIYLLISTGFAQVLLVFASFLCNLSMPFYAIQLLWLNIITNGMQDVALLFDRKDSSLMQGLYSHPRNGIFDQQMWLQIIVSSFAMAGLLTSAWCLLNRHFDLYQARNYLFLFAVLILNVQIFNCRSEENSLFSRNFYSNRFLWISIILAHGTHIMCMHIGFMQNTLRTQPVSLKQWVILFCSALLMIPIMEGFKLIMRITSKKIYIK